MQVHGQEGKPRTKRPPACQFHVGKRLDAMGFSAQPVAKICRNEQVLRGRIGLQDRGSRFLRSEVAILVEKRRHVKRHYGRYLFAVTRFGCGEAFIFVFRITEYTDESWKIIRPGEYR